MRLLNGRGELLRFGGEVMKNVAGYDVSRLMTGALGTLGVLLEISLKVLPLPEAELTLVQEIPEADSIIRMNELANRPLPLSALLFDAGRLYIRLSGNSHSVAQAARDLGGEELANADDFWRSIRDMTHEFFHTDGPLWRVSSVPALPAEQLPGKWLVDWGGAQRWYQGEASFNQLREHADKLRGHATLFRGGDRSADVFQPLPARLMEIHGNIKHSFDPQDIFNRGRLYRDW
jgi:glycolate oxidase FAD binding subunit